LFLEQYSANQYLAAGVKAIAKWNDNLHFRLEGYGFVPVQKIISGEQNAAKYHDKLFRSWHPMGMAAMVYQTNIGPLSAEVNYYDKAGQKFFFSLNLGYIIFNKKGLE
jgi:NTE family protein